MSRLGEKLNEKLAQDGFALSDDEFVSRQAEKLEV